MHPANIDKKSTKTSQEYPNSRHILVFFCLIFNSSAYSFAGETVETTTHRRYSTHVMCKAKVAQTLCASVVTMFHSDYEIFTAVSRLLQI